MRERLLEAVIPLNFTYPRLAMDFVTTVVKSSFNIKDLLQSTGSATKASFSVLLVLLYGYLTRRYKWLSKETEDVSQRTPRGCGPLSYLYIYAANIQALRDLLSTVPSLQRDWTIGDAEESSFL